MQSTVQDAGRRERSGGISLQTLLIASVAAAAASYVVSRVWGAGTIVGAAATPVIVAFVAEFLHKPVQTVSATAKRVPVVQRGPAVRSDGTPEERTRVAPDGRPREQVPPLDPGYVATVEADEGAPTRARPRWGLVLATGAAAFAIVVGVFTIPELVAGKSILGGGGATTYFGGSRSGGSTKRKSVTEEAPTTVTTTAPTTTTTVPGQTTTTAPTTTTPAPQEPAPTTQTTPTTPTTTAPTTATTPPAEPAVPFVP